MFGAVLFFNTRPTLQHLQLARPSFFKGFTRVVQAVLGQQFWRGVELKPLNIESHDWIDHPSFICKREDGSEVQIDPKWVIGADGRHSNVRKWLGGGVPSKNGSVVALAPKELIAGATIRGSCPVAGQYEVVRMREHGTAMGFSIGEQGRRVYVSVSDGNGTKLVTSLQNAMQSGEALLGSVEDDEDFKVSGYPANTEWFGPPTRGRFFLIGDALAVTTPYGGQGMSVAMEHVRFLNEQLGNPRSFVAKNRISVEYDEFAREVFQRVSLLNFGLYHVFFSRNPLLRPFGHRVLKNWENDRALQLRVIRLFGGLDRDIPTLPELLGLERFELPPLLNQWISKTISWA